MKKIEILMLAAALLVTASCNEKKESVMLSLLGGLMGVLLGLGISYGMCRYMNTDFRVSVDAIALGAGFSAGIGIIFGWAPARKASRLNPIDALRSA